MFIKLIFVKEGRKIPEGQSNRQVKRYRGTFVKTAATAIKRKINGLREASNLYEKVGVLHVSFPSPCHQRIEVTPSSLMKFYTKQIPLYERLLNRTLKNWDKKRKKTKSYLFVSISDMLAKVNLNKKCLCDCIVIVFTYWQFLVSLSLSGFNVLISNWLSYCSTMIL